MDRQLMKVYGYTTEDFISNQTGKITSQQQTTLHSKINGDMGYYGFIGLWICGGLAIFLYIGISDTLRYGMPRIDAAYLFLASMMLVVLYLGLSHLWKFFLAVKLKYKLSKTPDLIEVRHYTGVIQRTQGKWLKTGNTIDSIYNFVTFLFRGVQPLGGQVFRKKDRWLLDNKTLIEFDHETEHDKWLYIVDNVEYDVYYIPINNILLSIGSKNN